LTGSRHGHRPAQIGEREFPKWREVRVQFPESWTTRIENAFHSMVANPIGVQTQGATT
jgi:hypothetical protein